MTALLVGAAGGAVTYAGLVASARPVWAMATRTRRWYLGRLRGPGHHHT